MAEINYNNLYNQLKPMDKRYYDQQFSKNYVPGQENIKLSSQPAYDQMKAVYEAEQQVPETSIFNSIFGSASAAEMPQVPNLTYRNIDLPFDLGTGITNTKAASPFKIGISEILNRYNVPNSGSQDLVNQLIAENQRKISQFYPKNFQSIFPTNVQTGIRQQVPLQNLGIDTSYGVANEEDVKQEFLPGQERSGIAKLLDYIPFIGEKSLANTLLRTFLPEESPEIKNIKNFYRQNYGLDSIGRVDSGIMKGYNPVSGSDFLNKITGGFFPAKQFGLADAARRRINRIANRKIAQTDASRAKIKELQEFADRDTISRARQANKSVYESADRQGFTGPRGGFSTSGREGAFSSKTGRGRKDY
jgi:hypothetical protein